MPRSAVASSSAASATATTAGRVAASRAPAPEATDLFIALGAVVKRLRRNPLPGSDDVHSTLTKFEPAPRHIHALLHIAADGPIGMTELADRLHVSLATMSQVVTELDEWGLIERTTDAADRRRTLVSVTAAHVPLVQAILDNRMRPLARALRRLSADDGAALVRGLLVLSEELDQTDPANDPAAAEAKELPR